MLVPTSYRVGDIIAVPLGERPSERRRAISASVHWASTVASPAAAPVAASAVPALTLPLPRPREGGMRRKRAVPRAVPVATKPMRVMGIALVISLEVSRAQRMALSWSTRSQQRRRASGSLERGTMLGQPLLVAATVMTVTKAAHVVKLETAALPASGARLAPRDYLAALECAMRWTTPRHTASVQVQRRGGGRTRGRELGVHGQVSSEALLVRARKITRADVR